jgi:hypothetical protein
MQVGDIGGLQSLWYQPDEVVYMPELEEVTPPPYLSLTLGGPVHQGSLTTPSVLISAGTGVSRNRTISYVPTRMHSGLEMSVCMLAVDFRGLCRPLSDSTETCFK